jgi:hypothetical protein
MYTNIFCIISNCAIQRKERIGLRLRLLQVQLVFQRIAISLHIILKATYNLKEVECTLASTYQGTFKHVTLGSFYPCWIIILESKLILNKNFAVSVSFVYNFMDFDTELR